MEPSPPATPVPSRARPRGPLWLFTLGAGLVCGLIAWAGGEAIYPAFHVEEEMIRFHPANYQKLGGYDREAANSNSRRMAQPVVEQKRAAASFGLLGLVLAAGLGLIGGWAAGSSRQTIVGIVGGGLVAAAAGAGLSWAVVPLFFRFLTPDSGLLVLFLTHAAIFAGVGAASGLALGLGLGDRSTMGRAIFGGLLGALVGTMALEAINSLAFPLMRTFEPIASQGPPRGLMYACVAVGTALASGVAAARRPPRPVPAPAGWHQAPSAGDS